MTRFVAYYRVSTDRQEQTGLGLDAQRAAVARYVGAATILAEYTEVESGKKVTNRPQLAAALDACRKHRGAVLVIATLDRLARNLHFISGLMATGLPFVAADAPNDEPFILHMRAAWAEEEARKISQRTKAALAEAKRRGTQLGNPRWRETLHLATAARHPDKQTPAVVAMIHQLRGEGHTLRGIADQLHSLGIRTPRGKDWHPQTISDILARTDHQQEPAA